MCVCVSIYALSRYIYIFFSFFFFGSFTLSILSFNYSPHIYTFIHTHTCTHQQNGIRISINQILDYKRLKTTSFATSFQTATAATKQIKNQKRARERENIESLFCCQLNGFSLFCLCILMLCKSMRILCEHTLTRTYIYYVTLYIIFIHSFILFSLFFYPHSSVCSVSVCVCIRYGTVRFFYFHSSSIKMYTHTHTHTHIVANYCTV